MASRLSARNKVFIAGTTGAVVLFIGYYVLTAGLNVQENALGPRFPGREMTGVVGGFYLAFSGFFLLAASGFATGALYVLMAREEKLTSGVMLSMASGATAGLIVFLLASAATLASAFGRGPAPAISEMFMGAFDTAPVFILIMLLLALFAAAGAVGHRLARHTVGILKGRSG